MKKRNLILLLASTAILASCAQEQDNLSSEGEGGSSQSSLSSVDSIGSNESSSSFEGETEMTGAGTLTNPYVISNAYQLADFKSKANTEAYADKYYSLTADIETNLEWSPIGTISLPFSGVFMGNGHSISGLKITESDNSQTYQFYGFFGYASFAYITGLNLKNFTIDMDVSGKSSYVYIGGIVAFADTTSILYSSVEYAKFDVDSLQNGSSQFIGGGLAGLITLSLDDEENSYYCEVISSYVEGKLDADFTNADGVTSLNAGLVGYAITSSNGILSISNSYFHGSVTSGTYAAGLVGYVSSLASVVDSFAYGESIIATDTDGAYAAGVVGDASYNSGVLNTYAGFDTITATASTASYYKSYAGAVISLPTEDGYAEYSNYEGTALYNNYYKNGVALTYDKVTEVGEAVENVSSTFFKSTLGLSTDYWDFKETYPTLLTSKKTISLKSTITLSGQNKSVTTDGGYDYDVVSFIYDNPVSKEGYSFYGYTYDEEGSVTYRWYIPFFNDATLYPGLSSTASLVGTYDVTYVWYEKTGASGQWKFDNDYFYWLYTDGDYSKYEYTLYKDYIIVGEASTPVSGIAGTGGAYEDSIFIINEDGTISALDTNTDDAQYTAVKNTTDTSIPDFTDKGYLGSWKGYNLDLTIYSDGQVIAKPQSPESSAYNHYGGVKENDGKVTITVGGVTGLGEFSYDKTNDILYSGSNLLARNAISAIYKTSEVDLLIAVVGENKYIVKNGVLGDAAKLSGTLEDGQTITYDGTQYTISGTTLTKVETPDPDPEPVEENTYLGTWTVTAGVNKGISLVLNKDGSVLYNGNASTYTVNGTTIKFTIGDMEFSLTYNAEKQTLSGTFEYDYETYTVTSTGYEAFAKEEPEETATYVGTWNGTSNGNKVTLVLNEDGTGKYGDADITYTVKDNVISFTYGDYSGTLTYDSTNQTLKGTLVDDYEGYTLTLVFSEYVAPASNEEEEGISVASVSGTYTGTFGSVNVTITLNADGTGSLNTGTNMTFNWTVNTTTGVLTITNFNDPSYYYDDLALTYNPDGKTLTGTIVQDYEYTINISTAKN